MENVPTLEWENNFLIDFDGQGMSIPIQSVYMQYEAVNNGISITWILELGPSLYHTQNMMNQRNGENKMRMKA